MSGGQWSEGPAPSKRCVIERALECCGCGGQGRHTVLQCRPDRELYH